MLKKAIKLDPNYADAYAELADIYNTGYNYLANTKEESKNYLRLQEVYLDTAFNLDSTSAEVYFVKSLVYSAKAEYYASIGEYDKAVHEENEQFKCIKKVIKNIRKEGLISTLHKVNARLETPKALGYSSCGIIIDSKAQFKKFKPGDIFITKARFIHMIHVKNGLMMDI